MREIGPRSVRAAGISSDVARRAVEHYVFLGLPAHDIAEMMGVSESTLWRYYGDIISDAGKSNLAYIADSMMHKALTGDTTAAIFILKARAGWRDRDRLEVTGKDDGPIEIAGGRQEVVARIIEHVDKIKREALPAPEPVKDKEKDDE